MIKTRILDLPTQAATHAHPEHQLVVGLQGCADFEVLGEGGAVNRLHACLVPGGTAHAFSGRGHNHMLIMDLPAHASGLAGYENERLEALFERPRFIQLDHHLQGLLDFADHSLSQPHTAAGLNWHLGGVLLHALHDRLLMPAQERCRGLDASELLRIDEFVRQHMEQSVSVAALAALVCVSPSHFHSLFRDATGKTPHQHVLELRLREASGLLRETDVPVAQVASRCGFSSQSALNHAMRRQLGVTPRQLRVGLLH
ncbi:MAG: AraC family transcriptional regulator [Halopseudomonas sp.]|uniref:helix-turn-helix transcriptional regulator n=1 Tax=Halopseudomonas sp. TaxID=2901191 RepID=UPI003001D052